MQRRLAKRLCECLFIIPYQNCLPNFQDWGTHIPRWA